MLALRDLSKRAGGEQRVCSLETEFQKHLECRLSSHLVACEDTKARGLGWTSSQPLGVGWKRLNRLGEFNGRILLDDLCPQHW